MKFRPFLAALGASLCTGAALMVTLVNVELFGQGVLGKEQNETVFLLLWFLGALPVGAVIGGWVATRIGDRIMAFVGLLIAGFGYWLVSHWTVDVLSARHDLGLFTLPTFDTDLVLAGFGLGLVIGPLTSATLRAVPGAQHGIASASVVVARMIGMLIGLGLAQRVGLLQVQPVPGRDAETQGRQPVGDRRAAGGQRAGRLHDAVRRDLLHHHDRLRGGRVPRPADHGQARTRRGHRTPPWTASRART